MDDFKRPEYSFFLKTDDFNIPELYTERDGESVYIYIERKSYKQPDPSKEDPQRITRNPNVWLSNHDVTLGKHLASGAFGKVFMGYYCACKCAFKQVKCDDILNCNYIKEGECLKNVSNHPVKHSHNSHS